MNSKYSHVLSNDNTSWGTVAWNERNDLLTNAQ